MSPWTRATTSSIFRKLSICSRSNNQQGVHNVGHQHGRYYGHDGGLSPSSSSSLPIFSSKFFSSSSSTSLFCSSSYSSLSSSCHLSFIPFLSYFSYYRFLSVVVVLLLMFTYMGGNGVHCSESAMSELDSDPMVSTTSETINNAHHYPEHRLHRLQRQLHQHLLSKPQTSTSGLSVTGVAPSSVATIIDDPMEASESTLIIKNDDNEDQDKDRSTTQKVAEGGSSSIVINSSSSSSDETSRVDEESMILPPEDTFITTQSSNQNYSSSSTDNSPIVPTAPVPVPAPIESDDVRSVSLITESQTSTSPKPTTILPALNISSLPPGSGPARVVRRRGGVPVRMKVRRSNEFDVLTPADIAMLGLNNKRKLLKKVIKLRKKNNSNSNMANLVKTTSDRQPINPTDDSAHEIDYPFVAPPTTMTADIMFTTTEAPPAPPKKEKIICLSLSGSGRVVANDSDLASPKCFYALDSDAPMTTNAADGSIQLDSGPDGPTGSSPVTHEPPTNSILTPQEQAKLRNDRESDLLHVEESSSRGSRMFRHYMPPLVVSPQSATTLRSTFFKRIGLLPSSVTTPILESTTTTMPPATTSTTESPIIYERRESISPMSNTAGVNEENSIDSPQAPPGGTADADDPSQHAYVNVYEYPQETPAALQKQNQTRQNESPDGGDISDDVEVIQSKSSPDYYQLIGSPSGLDSGSGSDDSSSKTSSGTGSAMEQIVDQIVVLDNNNNKPNIGQNVMFGPNDQYDYGQDGVTLTTPSPLLTMSTVDGMTDSTLEPINQTATATITNDGEHMTTSIKGLWQVTRRKKDPKKSSTPMPSLSSSTSEESNSTTASLSLYERYQHQQQQNNQNKRPLRIPKLLLPKVNRPAMYSLNGYVPKPSLQQLQLQQQHQMSAQMQQQPHQRKNGRRQRNRKRKLDKKKNSGSRRQRQFQNRQSSSTTNRSWDGKKISGKLLPDGHTVHGSSSDEDDMDYDDYNDYIAGSAGDLIETSETALSHSSGRASSSHRRASADNHLVPSSSLTGTSSSLRKSLKKGSLTSSVASGPKASLSSIPKTSFECGDKRSDGVYADPETGCQVWHICQNGQMHSFLCPIGTIFSSKNGVCDWWYNTACSA